MLTNYFIQILNTAKTCKKNYLIYISKSVYSNIPEFNKTLNNLCKTGFILKNVFIINDMNIDNTYNPNKNQKEIYIKEENLLFMPMKDDVEAFGKIVNVFGKVMFGIGQSVSIEKDLKFIPNHQYTERYSIDDKYFYARGYDNSNSAPNLEHQWWYKWYMNVPLCASNRLRQLSGTCWFNTAINTLLLTPYILNIIIDNFNKNGQKYIEEIAAIPFNTCLSEKSLKTKLHVILYNLFINEKKGNNWIKASDNIIKSMIENNEIEGGRPIEAVNNIVNQLQLTENIKVIDLLKENIKELDILDELGTVTNFKLVNGKLEKIDSVLGAPAAEYDSTLPKVFIHNYSLHNAHKVININNCRYSLVASSLAISGDSIGHAIAGLKCNDVYYIYDSNNFIIKVDWRNTSWIHDYNSITRKSITFNHYNYLVYIKEDIKGRPKLVGPPVYGL